MSLRTRVTMLAAACVAGAVALVSLGAFVTVRNNLYSQLETELTQRALEVADASNRTSPFNGSMSVDVGPFQFSDIKFDIVDSNGTSHVNFVNDPTNKLPRNLVGHAEKAVAGGTVQSSARSVDGYEVVAVPYPNFAGANVALVAAEPLREDQNILKSLSLVLILISAAGVLVAAAAGTAVARGGLRPVLRLTRATEHVATTGDLRPIPVSGDDELARLTQSFNVMLGALAESQEQQRRLVADAGHELRTPLTSLRTNLELLLESRKPGAPTLSEQDTAELYSDVHGQLDELTTLIGDLVELARQDAPEVVHEPVELVEVVERALDRARRRSSAVSFDVQLQPWTLLGDASALERAVLNLLDNAVKFSPEGGVIGVTLRPLGDGTAVIEVTDQGPGITDEDLPRVFDRFYRSEEARTLPGSGLGLSIVMQAAQRHGGMAYAGRVPDGGALMAIRLPGRPG
ncbi:MAG TPA: HAMP domain-containing sensor histidine kinase [Pseudonocardiaceae bacterium]|nr:HAMP domain-containing sensor histidine kinase [Pseudonocardiaceae bacterium]